MKQYQVGMLLKDTRTNRVCLIEAVQNETLFTIKYINGTYRRYYLDRFTTIFKPYNGHSKNFRAALRVFIGDLA